MDIGYARVDPGLACANSMGFRRSSMLFCIAMASISFHSATLIPSYAATIVMMPQGGVEASACSTTIVSSGMLALSLSISPSNTSPKFGFPVREKRKALRQRIWIFQFARRISSISEVELVDKGESTTELKEDIIDSETGSSRRGPLSQCVYRLQSVFFFLFALVLPIGNSTSKDPLRIRG